jgi:F0F1-type ATP synthase membrane subunit b/b'
MAKLQDRAKDRASDVKPYIERALKDERVREDVKSAIATAREIYDELLGGRAVTSVAAKVATDKEIQQSLRDAIDDLRDAADRIQGKDSHAARNSTLLLTGIALGILFNPVTGPGTRRWLQDKIFGEGEEFEYRQDNAQ